MEQQIQRLDRAGDVLQKRDETLFAGIVKAYQTHDMTRASVLANELAEMRKIEKAIMYSRLALEQTVLRLRTVVDFGDAVSSLAPTMNVLRSVRTGLTDILPAAEKELGEIGDILQGVITDSKQGDEFNINVEAANEDSQKILQEAATAVEKKISKELPEIPRMVTADENRQAEAEQSSGNSVQEMEGN
jgi:division protein CdvB (Snf7/Vps24/ESCRT-III family)